MTCIQQPIHLMPDQQFQELDEKEKIKGYWLIQYHHKNYMAESKEIIKKFYRD